MLWLPARGRLDNKHSSRGHLGDSKMAASVTCNLLQQIRFHHIAIEVLSGQQH